MLFLLHQLTESPLRDQLVDFDSNVHSACEGDSVNVTLTNIGYCNHTVCKYLYQDDKNHNLSN